MRGHDQPINLLITGVGEGKNGPMVPAVARVHFNAVHDAVGTGCRGYLDTVGGGCLQFGGGCEVDRLGVETDIDRFHGARNCRRRHEEGERERSNRPTALHEQSKSPVLYRATATGWRSA